MLQYKIFNGTEWMKIFHHNMTKQSEGFNSFEEAKFVSTKNKYSILSLIDKRYLIKGKYEFLLEYPSIQGFNRWRQTLFPLDEHDEKGKSCVIGYEKVYISWNTSSWCGLSLSLNAAAFGCTPSLLDGIIPLEHIVLVQIMQKYPGPYEHHIRK